jgi:hypothetical protein
LNVLRSLLEENPQSIDVAELQVRELGGEALGNALLNVAYNFFEDGIDERLFFDQLSSAFIPIVDYKRWEAAEAEAGESGPLRDLTARDRTLEWTTFVPGSGWRGVLLPEDNSGGKALSVFTRFGGTVRALRFYRRGSDVHASVNLNRHCGLADFSGRCDPGACGDCEPRRRVVRPRGIICVCDHS